MGTTVSSGVTDVISSYVTAVVVDGGGTLDVVAGGYALDVTIGSGGSGVVLAGGTGFDVVVSDGAALTVLSGGLAYPDSVAGSLTVGTSGIASAATVVGAASVIVSSGGVATAFHQSAGTVTVLAGGSFVSAAVSGGTLAVASGGNATSATISAGVILDLAAGGTLVDAGFAYGFSFVVGSGIVLSAPGIGRGASVILESGGSILGGGEVLGTLTIASGAMVSDVGVGSGGVLAVESGGVAVTPSVQQVYGDGSVVISTGGVLSGAANFVTLEAGGSIAPGAGGMLSGLAVTSGASVDLRGGLATYGAEVYGEVVVGSGGSFSGRIDPGGLLMVANGGTASNIGVASGGTADIGSGGVAVVFGASVDVSGVTVLAGGTLEVEDRGNVTGLTVAPGGLIVVDPDGSAGPLTLGGGTFTVDAGGTATSVIADQGAVAVVSSAGTAVSDGVSGGTLVLQAGAVVAGGLVFEQYGYGGDIVIADSTLPTVPISGFGRDDTIDLPAIPFDPLGTVSASTSALAFTENGFDYTLQLASAGLAGRAPVMLADATGGTKIEVPCFAAGTRIATPSGEVPVEALRPGDEVLTLGGAAWRPRRVRWVGTVAIDLARHPRQEKAAPIRIAAGAFADGVPARDLLVSPDHALLVDGVLVQAQALANGATIAQEFPPRVAYWHVELDEHAILRAEGLPAESYRDTGNRGQFAGEAGVRALHPDLAGSAAPLVLSGKRLAAAKARLGLRALALGHRLTAEPALAAVAGQPLVPRGAGRWRVPGGTRRLHLLSRSFVPAWFGADDRRRLGIAVLSVRLDGHTLPEAAFGAGWHAAEGAWRWTDGAAEVILPPLRRAATLAIALTQRGERYWLAPDAAAAMRPAQSIPYFFNFS